MAAIQAFMSNLTATRHCEIIDDNAKVFMTRKRNNNNNVTALFQRSKSAPALMTSHKDGRWGETVQTAQDKLLVKKLHNAKPPIRASHTLDRQLILPSRKRESYDSPHESMIADTSSKSTLRRNRERQVGQTRHGPLNHSWSSTPTALDTRKLFKVTLTSYQTQNLSF